MLKAEHGGAEFTDDDEVHLKCKSKNEWISRSGECTCQCRSARSHHRDDARRRCRPFPVCFCPAHPFPAELHFFPQTKLHFSRPCLSVPRWRAQRTRAPAIRLDPQCTSCQTSRFLSFLIGTLRPLGTSPYVGTGTTCFFLWTFWDGLVSGPWQLISLDSEFSTQWSPISSGWI